MQINLQFYSMRSYYP